jgi:hypothetical protein
MGTVARASSRSGCRLFSGGYRAFDIARYRHLFDVVFDTAGTLSLGQCGAMLKRRDMSLHIIPR